MPPLRALILLTLASLAPRQAAAGTVTFQPGDLYYGPRFAGAIVKLVPGQPLGSQQSFADAGAGRMGQLAFSPDLTTMYASDAGGKVYSISASGAVSPYFDPATSSTLTKTSFGTFDSPNGLLATREGKLLLALPSNGTVLDITDPARAAVFAKNVYTAQNMVQLADGRILAGGTSAATSASAYTPRIFDITAGGGVAAATYATLASPAKSAAVDLEALPDGTLYASTNTDKSVYRFTPPASGMGPPTATAIYTSSGPVLTALALDPLDGTLYAGTSAAPTSVLAINPATKTAATRYDNLPQGYATLDFVPNATAPVAAPTPLAAAGAVPLLGHLLLRRRLR